MADSITLRVITPDHVVVDTTADTVRFPGLDGSVGVLKGHAAMVAALDSGLLSWSGSQSGDMFISGGFAEVRDNVVRVVTQSGEIGKEIDLDRAEESARRARERLRNRRIEAGSKEFDVLRAESALRRALMRKFVANRAKR